MWSSLPGVLQEKLLGNELLGEVRYTIQVWKKQFSCYRRRAVLSVAWVNCAVAQPLLFVFCGRKDRKSSTKTKKTK